MSGRALFLILLLSGSAAFAQSSGKAASSPSPSSGVAANPSVRSLVDSMDAADLQEAIQILKSNFIKQESLNDTELNRATLEGLLERLDRGVIVSTDARSAAPPDNPFFGEILEGHIGYLRPGAFVRPNLEALDAHLQTYAGKKIDAVVIDLRASSATDDFAIAADFTKRFCPKGKPLFTLRKTTARQERSFTSDRDPAYQGLIILLADGDTAGAPEAVAGVLRHYNKALLIGQPTAGRAVEYNDMRLPSGKSLRVAVGEAILPEGRPLFPDGLKPDVPVEMLAADKREVFQLSREKGMTQFVVEAERPHLNEAALMSGRNPDIEVMEAAQRRAKSADKPAVRDPVLQRALDLVTSISIFQKR